MLFKQINKNQLIATLTFKEMYDTGLAYATVHNDDEYTMSVVYYILSCGKDETGFNPQKKHISIDIIENSENGCEISFTTIPSYKLIENTSLICTPYAFYFDNLDNCINASLALFNTYCHRIYKSNMFLMNNKYYLTVYPLISMQDIIISFLSEYGEYINESGFFVYKLSEYGKMIISNNAIDKLSYFFTQPMQCD